MRRFPRALLSAALAMASLAVAAAPLFAAEARQTSYKISISSIDISAYPQISATLALSAPSGLRVPGLSKSVFTLLENGAPVSLSQVSEEEIGVQIAIVLEASNVFSRRDAKSITRLEYVKTALTNFAVGDGKGGNPYLKDVVDGVSVYAPEGPIIENSSVGGEIRNALVSYQSEFRFDTRLFNLISQALDAVNAAGPRPGMKREVVVFTSGIDASADAQVTGLAARANVDDVTIHTVLVGAPASQGMALAENVKALADLTGGSYRYFDTPDSMNLLWDTVISQRAQYRVAYRSSLKQSGQHTLQALANISGNPVLSPSIDFSLAIQPPTIKFVNPPDEIARVAQEHVDDAALIDPREQELTVKVEFPDSHRRNIAKLQLIVDNVVTDEKTSGPFDSLTWDLTSYGATGAHGLQVYIVDELGLEARSTTLNVTVSVVNPPPITTTAAPFAIGAVGIIVAVLAIVALVVAAIVLLRRPAVPTVITSIVHRTESRLKEPTEPFIPTPHGGIAQKRPSRAYLERTDELAPGPHPRIELNGDNLRLGRDETLAQITLNDKSVSRLHARITEEAEGAFFIHDEGSTSGTWVNYSQVSLSGQELHHSDLINLGRVQLRFNLRSAEPALLPTVEPVAAEPAAVDAKPALSGLKSIEADANELASLDEHSTEPFEPQLAMPAPRSNGEEKPAPLKANSESTDQGVKPEPADVEPAPDEYHTEAFTPTFETKKDVQDE